MPLMTDEKGSALTGLEVHRRAYISPAIIRTQTPRAVVTQRGRFQNINTSGTRPLERSLGTRPVDTATDLIPHRKMRGGVIIERSLNAMSSLSFSVEDNARFICNGGVGTGSFVSMFGRPVRFEANYVRYPEANISFEGLVKGVNPQFGSNGEVLLTLNAWSFAYLMNRQVIRSMYYPARHTGDYEQAVSALRAVEPALAKLFQRPWVDADTLSLKDIVVGISKIHKYPAVVSDEYDKPPFMYSHDDPQGDGKPKVLLQENETDWAFLQRLADENVAALRLDKDENGVETIYFQSQFAVRATDPVMRFIWNSPFGDGTRPHYISPEQVDLGRPGALPCWDVSPTVDLAYAAPALNGYVTYNAKGEAFTIMADHDLGGNGGFSIEGVDADKMMQLMRTAMGDPDHPDVKDNEAIQAAMRDFLAISGATTNMLRRSGLLKTIFTGVGLTGDAGLDSGPRPQYWMPQWKLSFSTLGTPFVKPGALIEVCNLSSFLEGTWLVNNVRHVLDNNSWSTYVDALRGSPIRAIPTARV